MQHKRRWVKITIWAVLLLVITAGAALSLVNSKKPQFNSETVKTRDIETFYTFTGNIEPDEVKTLYATGTNKVNKIYFLEGDTVEQDDRVMRLQSGQNLDAPFAGTISDIYVDINDMVMPGDPLLRLASYTKPIVTISVDEYDISAIKVGDQVKVYIQALDETVEGVVERVDREATVNGNVAYYPAKISLVHDTLLPMGMTCEVSVAKQSAINVPSISLSAIKFDEDNQPFIYLKDKSDNIYAEYVTLGVSNGTFTEVVRGLRDGDVVMISKDNTSMFVPFGRMQ